MKRLIESLEESTLSSGVVALFDGETMVKWPDVKSGGWPYTDSARREDDDEKLADKLPSYNMDRKQKALGKEIVKGQKTNKPGVWRKLRTGEKTLRGLAKKLGGL